MLVRYHTLDQHCHQYNGCVSTIMMMMVVFESGGIMIGVSCVQLHYHMVQWYPSQLPTPEILAGVHAIGGPALPKLVRDQS